MDGEVICEKGRHVNCLHTRRKAAPPKQAKPMQAAAAGPVEAYLASLAPKERAALEKVRKAILAAAPDAVEGVSYGMPAYKVDGHGVAGFAAFRDHLSYFPMSSTLLDALEDEVAAFRTSNGTLQFTLDRPLPATLVRKLVKARLAEARASKGP